MIFTTTRRDGLDRQINAMAADSEFTSMVDQLCCLRGIATLTGFGLAAEIGDWTRFDGTSIGAFLGLAPGEASSGDQRVVTSITKGRQHPRPTPPDRGSLEPQAHVPARGHVLARWAKAPGPVVAKAARARG